MHAGPPPEQFQRDHGCTLAEWLRWLPGAVAGHGLSLPTPDEAVVQIGPGELRLHWQVPPPRQIAGVRLPRLLVDYRFSGLDAEQRRQFLRYFDLYMQRGGG